MCFVCVSGKTQVCLIINDDAPHAHAVARPIISALRRPETVTSDVQVLNQAVDLLLELEQVFLKRK